MVLKKKKGRGVATFDKGELSYKGGCKAAIIRGVWVRRVLKPRTKSYRAISVLKGKKNYKIEG